MGRRQFAKNSTGVRHFKLVSRSQNDACAEDADTAPLVLEPFLKPGETRRTGLSPDELLAIPESLERLGADAFGLGERKTSDDDKEDAEEMNDDVDEDDLDGDCYFPKDGYDYEKHLKRVSGVGKGGGLVGVVLEAPKPVDTKAFAVQEAQTQEEKELERALQFADEYEELEEGDLDVMLPGGLAEDLDVVLWGPTALEAKDMPDLAAFKAAHKLRLGIEGEVDEDGEGSERREDGEGVHVGAEDFEQFLNEEYGKEEIGACDDEDIEGHMTAEACEEVLDDYLQSQEVENEMLHSINEPVKGKYDDVPRVIDETKAIIAKHYEHYTSDDEDTSSGEEEDESRNWDCETVLSTLSNLSNRPGKIGKIKVVGKPKPTKELPRLDEVAEEESADAEDGAELVIELPDAITERPRGETAEERRARKSSVKELRRICRRMKKESKEMYKNEAAKLPGNQATSDVKPKQRYQRL